MNDERLYVGFNLSPATMLALYKGELHIPDFDSLPDRHHAQKEIERLEKIVEQIKKENK